LKILTIYIFVDNLIIQNKEQRCILCPPNFYCTGSFAPPEYKGYNEFKDKSMYTFIPVGVHKSTAWIDCPTSASFFGVSMRFTHAIGLGSCFQTASVWQKVTYISNRP
jgi:hypothetical protein